MVYLCRLRSPDYQPPHQVPPDRYDQTWQDVHFSAQIASFTLTMMQYNILCTVKRFEAYETIGALFREATAGTLELSASDRIWELILDTILEIAEMISADASELLSAVIDANPKFHKLYQMYKLVA